MRVRDNVGLHRQLTTLGAVNASMLDGLQALIYVLVIVLARRNNACGFGALGTYQ